MTVSSMMSLLAAMALAGTAALPSAMAAEIDLSGAATGAPPAGFDFARTGKGAPGQWAIVEDASAVKGRAIAQTARDATDYRFPLAILRDITATNVEVSVRFKPVSGRTDQAGGIAVRVASADDYYVVRANALENNVRFYRVVKGDRQQIAGADAKVASGQWHSLSLKAEGDRFTVTFDGRQLYTAKDGTFAGPGRVALWTKADSVTAFDTIVVNALP